MFLLCITLINNSFAEEVEILYNKKTIVDFEGVEVEGELVKPEGTLLTEREVAKFNPLIRLRYDFNAEMTQSVNEVK